MSPAEILGDLPGLKFDPSDEELMELYLVPRVRGQPEAFPGVIIEDDSAANSQPWKLFRRHGLWSEPSESERPLAAFFYVRNDDAKPGARYERLCRGGGTWKSMKSQREHQSTVGGGEKIKWTRHNLNLQMEDDHGGSSGWVMHEYFVNDCPSLRIVQISFTGHGQKRKRVPDGFDDDCLAAGEPTPHRQRVAAADDDYSASRSTTEYFVQDSGAAQAFQDQENPMPVLREEEIDEMMESLLKDDAQPTIDGQPFSMPIDGEPFSMPIDEMMDLFFQQQFDEPRTTTTEHNEDQNILIWEGIEIC